MGKIVFFDGATEIGGTKLFVEVANEKFFFDFGLNYKRRGMYYEEFLNPRVANGIGDLYYLGLVPPLKGLYRKDLVQMLNKNGSDNLGEGSEDLSVDAVFLSHAHFDHSAYISLLREELPVYASPATIAILKAMEESGNQKFENKMFEFKKRGTPSAKNEEKGTHNFNAFESAIIFGSTYVRGFSVDHSVRGSLGFVVESSEGTIVYTGDLRLHGKRSADTLNFAKNVRNSKPDCLIIEGTNLRQDSDGKEFWTEQRVFEEAYEIFKKTNKLIVADFSIRDTDRLLTFLALSRVTGRKFVISLKDAYLLDKMKESVGDTPGLEDPDIYFYLEKHESGTYEEADYKRKWMKELLIKIPQNKLLKAEDIRANEGDFVITLRFFDLQELIDLKPSKGSSYIHSSSEAHSEEQEIDEWRMDNWLQKFNLYPRFHVHASGHAKKDDLFKIVDEIDPKVIIPVHTEHPEIYLEQFGKRVKIVKNLDKIEF
jgi:ribonuclease J